MLDESNFDKSMIQNLDWLFIVAEVLNIGREAQLENKRVVIPGNANKAQAVQDVFRN
jgi:hypothetical protein